jgi:hypothetical protein
MMTDDGDTLRNFYGMIQTDPNLAKIRAKKVAKQIASMGDKYRLAVPVKRKDAN